MFRILDTAGELILSQFTLARIAVGDKQFYDIFEFASSIKNAAQPDTGVHYSYHKEFTTKAPSITIGRSGNIGNPHLYEVDFWAHNTALYIKEFKNSDPKFIFYLLKTLDFTGHNSGSAVPSLNRNFIHPIKVFVPESIEEQKAIAKILSSLDNKIELNRRMNQTLEAMARALFQAWFVDFEPVHANAENRPSESASPEIAKFFPSEFENGIPKDWELKELKDVFEINPFRKLAKGQNAKFLDMANVPLSGIQSQN